MNELDLTQGLEQAWTNFITFMPKLLLAVAILVVGYLIAKLLAKLLNAVLERVGFDKLVERGGIKRALARTKYDASDVLSKILFYSVFLLVLQFAFGVFGPNPISDILNRVIAYLPSLFVAVVIIIVASGIAAAVKDILQATLGALNYGRVIANVAATFILVVGIFAALSQLGIAPAIVNGLFYAMLAIVAGSAIIAIGGGGILPMRSRWERWMSRMEEEAPRLREQMSQAPNRAAERAQAWKETAQVEASRPASETSHVE